MKYFKLVPVIFIVLSFLTALYFYPRLPDLMASHWGVGGEVNGYSSKMFGLFFVPILLTFLYLLFLILPKIDPYKKNFKQFENHFNNFVSIITGFLFYIYCLTIAWNLGYRFNMIQFMAPAMSLIFYYAGVLMSVAKRNWFVGIRTPWTMSSDIVWDKTHRLGGKLFKIVALFLLLGVILPTLAIYFIIFPILLVTAVVFAYSYWEFSKLRK